MDEQARKSARTRAAIAFGLAGVLLVVNVAAALAWRDERRDRFDGERIEFDQRTGDDRDQDDMMRPGGGQFPGGPGGQGNGPSGQYDQGGGQSDQGGSPPMGPGGRSGAQDPTDQQPGTDRNSSDQDQEGAA